MLMSKEKLFAVNEELMEIFENLLGTTQNLMDNLEKINPADGRENKKANLEKEKNEASELKTKPDKSD